MWTSSPALVVWHPRMEAVGPAVGNDQLMPSCTCELHIPKAQSFPNPGLVHNMDICVQLLTEHKDYQQIYSKYPKLKCLHKNSFNV